MNVFMSANFYFMQQKLYEGFEPLGSTSVV